MNRIFAAECGILPDTGESISENLQLVIDSLPDDTELVFAPGTYIHHTAVQIRGKKHLTLNGSGAVFSAHFSPDGPFEENNAGFDCVGCTDLTFRDMVWTTDGPTSCAGRVTAVDLEHMTFDVRLEPVYPVTGWEHLHGIDTCDEEGMPDYVIETYENMVTENVSLPDGTVRSRITGTRYSVIGDHQIRVDLTGTPDYMLRNVSRLSVGHRILFRYEIYGSTVYVFRGCHRVLLRDIEIERCTSMGAVILPRSSDFTFERFNMRIPVGDPSLYCANADGIHVTGLFGSLTLRDCHFVGLGDDALNVHSQAGEIRSIDRAAGVMECMYRDRQMNPDSLSPLWAEAGDVIEVYDRNTFLRKGTVTLSSYDQGTAGIASVTGEAAVGDILANTTFFPSVHIDGCSVRNTRARGFLLQSRNMLVENCTVSGMSLPGIIISPDIKVWYEVGPSENVEIRNCTFEKCAMIDSGANKAVIVMKASHDAGADQYPAGVHRNVRIHDNTFTNCGAGGIYVSAADGVEIRDNRFIRCSMHPSEAAGETAAYDIALFNCDHTSAEGNTTDKDPSLLFRKDSL